MTHSMSVFCVIRSATALSATAAVKIQPEHADHKAAEPGKFASIAQADTTLHDESSDVRTFAFGKNVGDTD